MAQIKAKIGYKSKKFLQTSGMFSQKIYKKVKTQIPL